MVLFWRKEYREKLCKTKSIVKNGETFLDKLITTFDGKRNPIRNFSSKELKLATNNYDIMNVVMIDGFVKLYKGFLLDRQILVMRAYDILKTKSNNWFIEAVDPIIVGDGLCPEIEQQLKVFWELAVKCRSDSGEDRPTMIDAAKQLRQLYLSTS
ncbi:hypothetical protein QYF36_011239 [Acer negundo]|nr:hypothetical protein QYF36_011239 [Acer negundo]